MLWRIRCAVERCEIERDSQAAEDRRDEIGVKLCSIGCPVVIWYAYHRSACELTTAGHT